MEELNYVGILDYHYSKEKEKREFDSYCRPLYWFVTLYCRKNALNKKDIAARLGITQGALTKKLDVDNPQHRALMKEDINIICKALGFPLASILFFYEQREMFENNITKTKFEKLTDLLSPASKNYLDFSAIASDHTSCVASKTAKEIKETSVIPTIEEALLPHLSGKWFFYFPSSDSSIIKDRKKEILKKELSSPLDQEKKELYDLYTPDHIYSGVFEIEKKDRCYKATMKYMTNPQNYSILRYEGSLSCLSNTPAVFLTLTTPKDDDIIYMVIDTLSIEQNSRYIMAAILFLSRNKVKEKRRPCSMRMILTRERIHMETPAYKVLLSNLMMNDSVIRIDKQGYEELRKYQEQYGSIGLNTFLEKYPEIEYMKGGRSNYINVYDCAYINESLLRSFGEMDDKDRLYLEALLRYHSLAPWYAKTKSSKTNSLLKLFNDT